MHGLIKIHKVGNPARLITSGCSTAVKRLFIFVETVLFDFDNDLLSGIRGNEDMLNITDELKRSNLPSESVLVAFIIVTMFARIDNNFGLKKVFEILESHVNMFPPTQFVT